MTHDRARKIVVVDDEPAMISLYTVFLENQGFQVFAAANGVDGLTEIEREQPDLVILNLMMPGMHGWDVAHHLKGSDSTKDIPILIVSAKAVTQDIETEILKTIEGYVTKPFSPDNLRRNVKRVLNLNFTVYLEIGEKRTFAGAIDWPGWCRSGRDEESALQALLDYAPRYAAALSASSLDFDSPADLSALEIVERLPGSSTTDFGAPGEAPTADSEPITGADITHYEAILRACWQAFDAAVDAAAGHDLRKGPRGGGRDRDAIIRHVLEGDQSYLGKLGAPYMISTNEDLDTELARIREAILDGLSTSASGSIAAQGPRGSKRWTAHYFVRRSAWHILDHAWEIEDRIE